MKVKPTLMLSMHCPEGRAMVQLGLDDLTEPERAWLFDKLKKAEKGRSVSFGVETEGSAQIIKFTLGATAEAVT
jgi:hypothetical protein